MKESKKGREGPRTRPSDFTMPSFPGMARIPSFTVFCSIWERDYSGFEDVGFRGSVPKCVGMGVGAGVSRRRPASTSRVLRSLGRKTHKPRRGHSLVFQLLPLPHAEFRTQPWYCISVCLYAWLQLGPPRLEGMLNRGFGMNVLTTVKTRMPIRAEGREQLCVVDMALPAVIIRLTHRPRGTTRQSSSINSSMQNPP